VYLLKVVDSGSVGIRKRSLERSLEGISTLLGRLGLTISPTKTQFCVFKGPRRKSITYTLNVSGVVISSVSKVKFLGLYFQSNLSWESHILSTEKRCFNGLRTLSCLGRTWWGADTCLLLRLYRALIRSRLEYGGFLFHNLSRKLSTKLDKIQMKALRIAMGYRNSTPLNVILAEAREPPLFIRFEYLGANFLTRVMTMPLQCHFIHYTLPSVSLVKRWRPPFVRGITRKSRWLKFLIV